MSSPTTPSPTNTTPIKQEIKPLLTLMAPILVTQFAQIGLGLIDTIMAGRLSANDLASTGIAVGLWTPVMLLFFGIILATTPLIAKARGEKNFTDVVSIAQNSLMLAFVLGLVAMGVMFLMPLMLPVLQVPEALIPKAARYLHFVAFGLPAVMMYATLRCYSESLGFARPVMVIALLALPVMIPVNYAFMYGVWGAPRLEGPGAGLATAIIQWLSLVVLAGYIYFSKNYAHAPLFKTFYGINTQRLRSILALGLPIGMAIFFEVAIFSTASIVIAPLGELVVAAHQVTLSITSVLFMIPMSLANALTIRVGLHFGEQDKVALFAAQKFGFMLATALTFVTMVFLYTLRAPIVAIYTSDLAVAGIAVQLVLFAVAYQLVDAWQICAAGCLRGVQETKTLMWIMLFVYWGVAFPLGFYWVRHTDMGVAGIWLALVIGLSFACLLLVARLLQVNRRLASTLGISPL